ncbi:MAG: hypothetical protein KJS79_03520 [Rhodospirillales bacterium]|nr:hypothetical protein [Rhodospirillales bacterium]
MNHIRSSVSSEAIPGIDAILRQLGPRSHLETDSVETMRKQLADAAPSPIGRADVPAMIGFGYRVAIARLLSAGLPPEQIFRGDCGAAALGIAAALKQMGAAVLLAIGHQVPLAPRRRERIIEARALTESGRVRHIPVGFRIPQSRTSDDRDPLWIAHVGLAFEGRIFDSRGVIGIQDLAPEDAGYERGIMVSMSNSVSRRAWEFIRPGTSWMVSPRAYEASLIEAMLVFRPQQSLAETRMHQEHSSNESAITAAP